MPTIHHDQSPSDYGSPLLPPDRGLVNTIRPMFQVLADDSQNCVCDINPGLCISVPESMSTDQDEYARPDRIFL